MARTTYSSPIVGGNLYRILEMLETWYAFKIPEGKVRFEAVEGGFAELVIQVPDRLSPYRMPLGEWEYETSSSSTARVWFDRQVLALAILRVFEPLRAKSLYWKDASWAEFEQMEDYESDTN